MVNPTDPLPPDPAAGPAEQGGAAGSFGGGPKARARPERPRRIEDFDAIYASQPPWDIDRPQPAFAALAAAGEIRGRVLDVGCGTGEHALMAAGLGLPATGVDAARAAIDRARAKAEARSVTGARFILGDALDLPAIVSDGEQFDTVVDSGVFHVFGDDDRGRFVASLAAVVPVGGWYFMLCFSQHQPGDWGPRRVTEAEIRSSFSAATGWNVESIEPARFVLTLLPTGAHAWLAVITRI